MPYSEKARRAAFAEVRRRKQGGKPKLFEGMGTRKLEEYAHEPLEKARKIPKRRKT